MPKYQFDHIHLNSPDPPKTAEFYQKMFGATLVKKLDMGNGRIMVKLDLGGVTMLISKPAGDGAPSGLVHFGIKTDNLPEAVDELKARGVKFTKEITEVRPQFKISFLTAPENVSIELQNSSL